MTSSNFYNEQQRFGQLWLLIIIHLALLISIGATVLFIRYEPAVHILLALLPAVFGIILYLVLIRARLILEISDQEIRYQFWPFHLVKRIITKSHVDVIAVVTYDPLSDYGGWGIRIGKDGWAYTTAGHTGLLIKKNNGKNLLIGTSRPAELTTYLESNWAALLKTSS